MKRKRLLFFVPDDGGGTGGGAAASQTLIPGEQGAGSGEQQQQSAATKGFVNEDGSFVEGWHSRLPDDLGEYRDSLGTKFKNVGDLAKSYHGLEQRLGKHATAVYVPGEGATPEEMATFRKAMGIPENVDGYKDIKPAELPEGLEWQDDNVKPFLEAALKHGIKPEAMKDLVAIQLQQEHGRLQQVGVMAKEHLDQGTAQLQKDWGSEYPQNLALAAKTARRVGLDPLSAAGLADPATVKAFAELGKLLGDDKFVASGGGGGSGVADPAAEAKKIMTDPEHPDYKKYQEGDKEVTQKVLSLLQGKR